jgi:hypothetical protein
MNHSNRSQIMSGANDMSEVLAAAFSTSKVASATPEDIEKRAQIEFFNGLCKEQGINVADLNDEQVDQLYKAAMDMRKEASEKEAGEMPPQFAKKDGDKKDEKKGEDKDEGKKEAEAKVAAAEAEFMAKKAAATKVAEADAMGRIMAHSFVAELDKIAEARGGEGFPFPPKKDGDKDEKKDEKKDGEKKEASSAEKAAAVISAFQNKTAGAAGGSSTPNFDEQACYHAIEMLKTAGVNADEAFGKVNAVYTLGLKDSVKLASAPDAAAGLEIRALEICEAAGYAVTWNS